MKETPGDNILVRYDAKARENVRWALLLILTAYMQGKFLSKLKQAGGFGFMQTCVENQTISEQTDIRAAKDRKRSKRNLAVKDSWMFHIIHIFSGKILENHYRHQKATRFSRSRGLNHFFFLIRYLSTVSFGLGETSGYWRRSWTLAINLLQKGLFSCHGARRVLWQEKKIECLNRSQTIFFWPPNCEIPANSMIPTMFLQENSQET